MEKVLNRPVTEMDMVRYMDMVKQMIQWNAEEISFLMRHWESLSTVTIAERLGRSVNSVAMKAEELGLVELYRIED